MQMYFDLSHFPISRSILLIQYKIMILRFFKASSVVHVLRLKGRYLRSFEDILKNNVLVNETKPLTIA